MLALAHFVEQEIGAGAIPDYATAARDLGLSRARLTQVMNLLLLSPEMQEQVLMSKSPLSERALRGLVSEPRWARQQEMLDG